MKVVVYYRTRPDDPAASDLSLSAQKAFVGGWLELKTSHVVAEYTEFVANRMFAIIAQTPI